MAVARSGAGDREPSGEVGFGRGGRVGSSHVMTVRRAYGNGCPRGGRVSIPWTCLGARRPCGPRRFPCRPSACRACGQVPDPSLGGATSVSLPYGLPPRGPADVPARDSSLPRPAPAAPVRAREHRRRRREAPDRRHVRDDVRGPGDRPLRPAGQRGRARGHRRRVEGPERAAVSGQPRGPGDRRRDRDRGRMPLRPGCVRAREASREVRVRPSTATDAPARSRPRDCSRSASSTRSITSTAGCSSTTSPG